MSRGERPVRITVTIAARRAGLEPHVVRQCVQVGLVDETLTEDELIELRRVRRLIDLGVNLEKENGDGESQWVGCGTVV